MARVAIVGYGNVGRGVHRSIERNSDMKLVGIFTRDPKRVKAELGIEGVRYYYNGFRGRISAYKNGEEVDVPEIWRAFECPITGHHDLRNFIDVAVLCGGSKNDLPEQGPEFVRTFNTVDSFDTHEDIAGHFAKMDKAARGSRHVAVISAGWDPGTFSLERVLADAFIPGAKPQRFYGLTTNGGLSMGHSNAVRDEFEQLGVVDAKQYTHGIHEAIEQVRRGENPDLKPGERVWREVYVVVKDGADKEQIANSIKSMPDYFLGYRTTVNFVTQEELDERHSDMPHDGLVLAVGETGDKNRAMIEYKNEWASNPEATGNILVACARAANRFSKEGRSGAYTMLDIPASYLSPKSREELLRDFM